MLNDKARWIMMMIITKSTGNRNGRKGVIREGNKECCIGVGGRREKGACLVDHLRPNWGFCL